MMSEGKYTLARLSELTELPERKVRFYMHAHLVPPPEAKGKGRFGDEQLAALLAVRSLRDAGLSLGAIKDYLGIGGDDAGEEKAPGAGVIAEIVAALKMGADLLQPARLRELTDSILGVGPTLFSKVFSSLGRRAKPHVERMPRSTWERIPVTGQLELHVKRPLSKRQDRALEQLMERAEELFSEGEAKGAAREDAAALRPRLGGVSGSDSEGKSQS